MKIIIIAACLAACSPPAMIAPTPASAVHGAIHVAFPSRDGDLTHGAPTTIDGWLFRPAGAGPHPAMVLLHGCAGLYAKAGDLTARHRDWAERFAAAGYLVLLPDSFGPRGVKEICSDKAQRIRPGYERSRDAYGAFAFLAARPDVDPAHIGVLGWSNGGSTLLNAISAHTRARPKDLAHDFRVAIAMYPGCERVDERTDWLPPIAPLHVLIGAIDDWTPPAKCVDLVDRAKAAGARADIVVYPDAYHDFDDPVMKVHVRDHVATTASHTATIGQNPAARADAIARVMQILHDEL